MINNQRGVKRRVGYNILVFGKPKLNNCFRAQKSIVPTSLYLVWQRPGDKSKTTNLRLQQMLSQYVNHVMLLTSRKLNFPLHTLKYFLTEFYWDFGGYQTYISYEFGYFFSC